MPESWRHRLFVMHAPAETDWVSGVLGPRLGLSEAEILTFRGFMPGRPLLGEVEHAITSCELSLAVITQDFLRDPLSQVSEQLAAYLMYLEGQGRFVVLRLDDAEIPAYLRSRVILDGRDALRLQQELDRLARLLGQMPPPRTSVQCPYPGMVPFTRADENRFFGRASEVSAIASRIEAGASLVIVIGPSGSGKSSLLAAGLVPALASDRWSVHEMRPAAAVTHDLAGVLAEMPAGVRLLWLIDQFEEVFTSLSSGLREHFFAALQEARKDPRCALVLALRADFFGDLMGSPLWPLLPEQRVEIGPLAGDRLKEAIRWPAQEAGFIVANDLTERLIADAKNQPGALPFLQETLRSLWKAATDRGDRLLSRADYDALSRDGRTGLELAVAAKADAALAGLPSDLRFSAERQRLIAQRTLIRLVHFGPLITRRQQRWDDLRGAGDDPDEFDATLRYLADQRLITTGEDRVVDLAHEALLSGWKTLQDWIRSAESAEQVRRYYEGAALNWKRLGCEVGGRLDAGELAEIERWRASKAGSEVGVTPLLAQLIDYSRRRLQEEQATLLDQERKRTRSREHMLLVLGILLLSALVSLLVTFLLYRRTQRQEDLLLVQRLLDLSRLSLTDKHIYDERAALYARQAYLLNRHADGPYEGLAYEAMRHVLYDRYFFRELSKPSELAGMKVQSSVMSANGAWVVAYDNDDSGYKTDHDNYRQHLVWWNLRELNGRPSYLDVDLPWQSSPHLAVADNGTAALLTRPCTVLLVDLAKGRARDPIVLGDERCWALAISPSGAEIAFLTPRGVRRVLIAQPGVPSSLLPDSESMRELHYFPDGSRLAGVTSHSVRLWSLPEPRAAVTLSQTLADDSEFLSGLRISASGAMLAFRDTSWYADLRQENPVVRRRGLEGTFEGIDAQGRMVLKDGSDLWIEDDHGIRQELGKVPYYPLNYKYKMKWSAAGSAVFDDGSSLYLYMLPQRLPSTPYGNYDSVLLTGPESRRTPWIRMHSGDLLQWDPYQPSRPPQTVARGYHSLCSPGGEGVWALTFTENTTRAVRIDPDGKEVESLDLSAIPFIYSCSTTDAPDTLVLHTGSSDLHIVRVAGGRMKKLMSKPKGCGQVAISPAGDRFACSGSNGNLLWGHLDSAGPPRTLASAASGRMVFSPDAQWLAGSGGQLIEMRQTERPDLEPELLRGHADEVTGLAFSPDGDVLASSGGVIRLWPRRDPQGEPWVIASGGRSKLQFLDAEHLLLIDRISINVLDLNAERMAARICQAVSRNLREDEWKTALPTKGWEPTCPDLRLQ